MATKAQRQKATNEMIVSINSQAEKARLFREKEYLRMAAIKAKEAQEKRDEEITKCALFFALGLFLSTVCITVALWLLGIHPMQHIGL